MAIYQKNGSFWIDYYFQGKRLREKVGPNKTVAKQALAKRKAEIAENKFFPDKNKPSVAYREMADLFWNLHGRFKKTVSYFFMNKRCLAEFGDKRLDEITIPVAQEFLNRVRTESTVSNSNRYHTFLRCLFNRAIDWEKFKGINPFSKIKQEKEPAHRLQYLSKDDISKLLSVCPARIHAVVACALFTGMRRGEILGLTWENVDLEHGVIYILEAKSGRPREIPLSPKLAQVFDQLRTYDKKGKIFDIPINTLDGMFKRALNQAGISEFRFHDLRHTFASHFVMRTNDLPTLQKILGHHSPTMTQRYAHLSRSHMQVGMVTFDAGMDTIWTPKAISDLPEKTEAFDSQPMERCLSG